MNKQKKSIWKVDIAHSIIQFKVKHMAIAQVSGVFTAFSGQLESEGIDFEGAGVNFEISADSINTNNAQRDEHLQSDIFFNVKVFPKLTFIGKLQLINENYYELIGQFTMHGITLPLNLAVEFSGTERGRFGENRAAFEIKGKLNRKDYGLTWNMLTEAGGLMVGEEIKLHMDIQLIQENKIN